MGNRRIWWGLGIMAAGVCAAWPFRKAWLPAADAAVASAAPKASPAPLLTVSAAPAKLTRAHADEIQASSRSGQAGALVPLASALDRSLPRRQIVKVDETAPAPPLAADYGPRGSDSAADARSAVLRMDTSSPTIATPPPPAGRRTYRIRKHDTLDGIAERLLGSRKHADKLLAANPEVILVPEILPVGATIFIPELSQPAQSVVRVPDSGN